MKSSSQLSHFVFGWHLAVPVLLGWSRCKVLPYSHGSCALLLVSGWQHEKQMAAYVSPFFSVPF